MPQFPVGRIAAGYRKGPYRFEQMRFKAVRPLPVCKNQCGVVGNRVPMSESTYRFGMYVPGSKADALVPICHILFDCQSALFR